jgi:MoaA/NifB/PqqE/SkfB family radical SAM enzyme
MFNRETFCTLPWSSILILPSGDFKICCFSGHHTKTEYTHGVAVDDNGNVMNVLTHDIMEAMNSKWHKELRLTQQKGERHPTCKVCWDRDDAAKTEGEESVSLRVVRSFYQNSGSNMERIGGQCMTGSVTPDIAPEIMKSDGSINIMPMSLDMRFSNLCNMKCIMCEPTYSNLWYEDHIALYGKSSFLVGPKTYKINKTPKVSGGFTYSADMDAWNTDPRWWAQFDKIAPHLRHIYLTGGEPFVQPVHDVFIQKLIEREYAKDIVLEYDTNMSVINPKILGMLKQFKDVIFRVSIDDINEQYELIRFPGKFERVNKNMKMLEEFDMASKVVGISTCVGIHSIFAPIRLYNHFKPMNFSHISIRTLRAPAHLDIANLPPSIKEKVIETYQKSGLPDRYQFPVVGYLKNNMNQVTEEQGKQKLQGFVAYMNSLDKLRGTDWKVTFPEVVALISLAR